jgi:hypothetical protein
VYYGAVFEVKKEIPAKTTKSSDKPTNRAQLERTFEELP